MPWRAEIAIRDAKLNEGTVTREQIADRLQKCAACKLRRGCLCTKSGQSVNIVCKYPRFECPIGEFGRLARRDLHALSPPTTANITPATSCGTRRQDSDTVIQGQAKLPTGDRERYACDVVIAYCHDVKWLPDSIDSILNQNCVDVTIHVINDCTPEDDFAVRQRYAHLDNVHWYDNQENIGPYASLHNVWHRMQQPYWAIQDADDISTPNRLWRGINALITHGCDVYGGRTEQFIDHSVVGETVRKTQPINPPWRYFDTTQAGSVMNSTRVATREILERVNGFASSYFMGCDCEFDSRLVYAGAKFFADDTVVVLRRLHNAQLTAAVDTGLQSEHRIRNHTEWRRRAEIYKAADSDFDWGHFGDLDKARPEITAEALTSNLEPDGEFTRDWVASHVDHWRRLFATFASSPNVRMLEIGSFEGRSALWFLDNVLTGDNSHLTCVDRWNDPAIESRFQANMLGRLNVRTIKSLAWDAFEQLRGERFNLIYLDGGHEARVVFENAVQCFRLLQVGGVLLFDDYTWNNPKWATIPPRPAIDGFLASYVPVIEVVHKDRQVAIRKTGDV